jgi:hypothetical protein
LQKTFEINEIKDLIRKKVTNLKDFDLKYHSSILNEKDDLNMYATLNELTVIKK